MKNCRTLTFVLLKFLTSWLKQGHFTRSCQCGAHSAIIFVWLFLFMKLSKWLSPFWEYFCPHHWNLPIKLIYPFFFWSDCNATISCSSYHVNASTKFNKPTDHKVLSKDIFMRFTFTASCTAVANAQYWVTFMLWSISCVYLAHTCVSDITTPC